MTVRAGTKSAAAIAVMEKMADKPMDKVVPKIAEAAGLDMDKAKHYYVLFVRKGLAPGEVPGKAPKAKAEKPAKAPKAVKAAAKAVKAVKPSAPTKSPEEIERIKAANMERMKSVLAKTKQSVRKEDAEAPAFGETDAFAAPAFLTKDEVSALV
jgi:Sec-independent protein translocase protein TatA